MLGILIWLSRHRLVRRAEMDAKELARHRQEKQLVESDKVKLRLRAMIDQIARSN